MIQKVFSNFDFLNYLKISKLEKNHNDSREIFLNFLKKWYNWSDLEVKNHYINYKNFVEDIGGTNQWN